MYPRHHLTILTETTSRQSVSEASFRFRFVIGGQPLKDRDDVGGARRVAAARGSSDEPSLGLVGGIVANLGTGPLVQLLGDIAYVLNDPIGALGNPFSSRASSSNRAGTPVRVRCAAGLVVVVGPSRPSSGVCAFRIPAAAQAQTTRLEPGAVRFGGCVGVKNGSFGRGPAYGSVSAVGALCLFSSGLFWSEVCAACEFGL